MRGDPAAATATQVSSHLAHRLKVVLRELPQDGIPVCRLVSKLGTDADWLALLLLGAAALVPTPGVPLCIVCGGAIALVAVQRLCGVRELPAALARRQVPRRLLATLIVYLVPWIERVEGYLRPRLGTLSAPGMVRVWAAAILLQGMVIVLPIPLGNPLPGIAVAALALGLMHRDGMALLIGLVCCVFSVIWTVVVIALGAEIANLLLA